MNSRALMLALALGLTSAAQAETLPDTVLASVDLRTTTGVAAVQAAWRYSDVRILPVISVGRCARPTDRRKGRDLRL